MQFRIFQLTLIVTMFGTALAAPAPDQVSYHGLSAQGNDYCSSTGPGVCHFWLSVDEEPDGPGMTYEWKVSDRGCVEYGESLSNFRLLHQRPSLTHLVETRLHRYSPWETHASSLYSPDLTLSIDIKPSYYQALVPRLSTTLPPYPPFLLYHPLSSDIVSCSSGVLWRDFRFYSCTFHIP